MSTTNRLNVLVVNDDPASLLALSGSLSVSADRLGYNVLTARSGKDALREILLRRFAVILLDVNMPDMDGFETAAAIRSRAVSADTPIIFITAFMADEVSKLNAYRYDAADFLFSPIIPQVLAAKVEVFVSLAAKNEELFALAETLEQQSRAIAESNARLVIEMQEREVVENSSRAKDTFLAMLSHELRNPLAAIKNASSLLALPTVSDALVTRANGIISRQTMHLREIVNEILDLSRAMSGKIKLSRESIDLSELVSACVDRFLSSGRAEHRSVDVSVAPVWVHGDRERLAQIVNHLIENALKYTPEGGNIHVDVCADGAEAVVTVRDTGSGIPAEFLPHIFDVFAQGSVSLDRSMGGLGIGLAIVQCLVCLHDGLVSVHSDGVDRGSEFVVRLPVLVGSTANEPKPARPATAASPGVPSGVRENPGCADPAR
jgi:signal transduction histidine kinase